MRVEPPPPPEGWYIWWYVGYGECPEVKDRPLRVALGYIKPIRVSCCDFSCHQRDLTSNIYHVGPGFSLHVWVKPHWSETRLSLSKCQFTKEHNERWKLQPRWRAFLLARRKTLALSVCLATLFCLLLLGKLGSTHNECVLTSSARSKSSSALLFIPNPIRTTNCTGIWTRDSTVRFGTISFNNETNSSLKCTICRPPKHFTPSLLPIPL